MPAERRTPGAEEDADDDLPAVRRSDGPFGGRQMLVGGVAAIAAYALTSYKPALGFLAILLIAAGAVGALLGAKVLRSRPSVRAVVAWAGLLTWLLPFLGALSAGAVLG